MERQNNEKIPHQAIQKLFLDYFTLEARADRLSRNVGNKLPIYAAKMPEERRSQYRRGRSLKSQNMRIFLHALKIRSKISDKEYYSTGII